MKGLIVRPKLRKADDADWIEGEAVCAWQSEDHAHQTESQTTDMDEASSAVVIVQSEDHLMQWVLLLQALQEDDACRVHGVT